VCDQLRTPDAFIAVTTALAASLAGQRVPYAEVTVSPLAHVLRGIPADELFDALEIGRGHAQRAHGLDLRWCAAFGTRRGPKAAMEAVEMVLAHRRGGFVSVGIAGLESAESRRAFAPAFALARDAGLHCVAHAGEASGAASIWEAIDDLGAERIGHGIRCIDDSSLVARLRTERIPLEVCPTSNVVTGVVRSLTEHPLRQLLDAGLVVTLNSDDPAMCHTTLTGEYELAERAFGLARSELVGLARASIRSSFLQPEEQDTYRQMVDAVASSAEERVPLVR
jgi:aminodeoxyfutalosine deaminase